MTKKLNREIGHTHTHTHLHSRVYKAYLFQGLFILVLVFSSLSLVSCNSPKTIRLDFPRLNLSFENNFKIENITKNKYVNCEMTIVDDITPENNLSNIPLEIKGHGNSSFNNQHDKKGFKLNFNKKINPFNLGEEKSDSGILLANDYVSDKSYIKNSMLINAAKDIMDGFDYVVNLKEVNLYIDDLYYGAYTLIESIEDQKGRIDVNAKYNSDNDAFLFEYDIWAKGEQGVDYIDIPEIENISQVSEASNTRFTIHSPNPKKYDSASINKNQFKEITSNLSNYLTNVANTLNSGSGEEIKEYIDLPSGIDYYILEHFSTNGDINGSSTGLYKENNNKHLKVASPGDLDATLSFEPQRSFREYRVEECSRTDLYFFIKLGEHDEFKVLTRQRGNSIRKSLMNYFDEYIKIMSVTYLNSMTQNYKKWYEKDDGLQLISKLKNGLQLRFEFLSGDNIDF